MTGINRTPLESSDQPPRKNKERASEFKAYAVALIMTVTGIILVVSLQKGLGIKDSAIVVTLLLIPLLIYGMVSGRLREIAVFGWSVKMEDLESKITGTQGQVERQQETLDAIRVLLEGLITRFEYEKLEGLDKDGPFMCYFHDNLLNEMKSLFDHGYVKETKFGAGPRINDHRFSGQPFDLKEHFVLDERGIKYLQCRRGWHLQEKPDNHS